jgi:hypothetical protein
MRLNNRFATLVFTCLMAVLGMVFSSVAMSMTHHVLAQSGELPSSYGPSSLENLAEGGPLINISPDPAHAVGVRAALNVQITNSGGVTLTYMRTDFEPSKPAYVLDSTCDKLGADAEAVFGPNRELGPHGSISYNCVVTMTAVAGTYPFTLRVRSADPANPNPLFPFLGDADHIQIIVGGTPPMNVHRFVPIARRGS